MKTNVISKLMILSSLLVFSACPGKKDDNNAANVVGPQGRIMALSSQNTYCDISAGTIKCSSIVAETGYTCNTNQKVYNPQDMGSFCQKMQELKYESTQGYGACDASAAVDRILNESCKGIATPGFPANPNPGNPGYPNPGYPGQNPNFPIQPIQPASFINCDIQIEGKGSLRYPLLAGSFKNTYVYRSGLINAKYKVLLRYTPKSLNCEASMDIEVTHREHDRKVEVKHSGFAGQPLLLNMDNKVVVSCLLDGRRGQGQAPSQQATAAAGKRLVCKGNSDTLAGGRPEEIDVNKNLNEINEGEKLQLSASLDALIDKSKGTITYRSLLDSAFGPDINATSSLRIPAILQANEGMSKVNVKCSLE